METDLDAAMAAIEVPVHAAIMDDDWLAPESSLRFLLSKLPRSPVEMATFDARTLGTRVDHFAWMRGPEAVAAFLATPSERPMGAMPSRVRPSRPWGAPTRPRMLQPPSGSAGSSVGTPASPTPD